MTLIARLGPAAPQGIAPPSGQVLFRDNNLDVGSGAVSAGVATLELDNLAPGPHQLVAVYLGDRNWAAGYSATLTVTVSTASTTTTLTPSIAPPNRVILTANIASSAPGAGKLTGSVQFVDTVKNTVIATATVAIGAASATFSADAAAAVEGRPIAAVYSGDDNFQGSTSAPLPPIANAAWNFSNSFAPDEIASLYGVQGLNGDTTAMPAPAAALSGVTVTITDSTSTVRPALLSGVYASASQINILIPGDTAAGLAIVTITLPGGGTIATVVNIAGIAPGIFTASSTGQGVYAGQVAYVHPDGSQAVASSTAPIIIAGGNQVYLVLYGTGLRHAGSLTATVNGASVPVSGFSAQGQYDGLDQINVGPLPANLAGAGVARLTISVDGQAANAVTLSVQ